MNKRVVIDQDLCDKLQLMMAGKPRRERVAKLLGISIPTLDRIKQAGYDAGQYRENMRAQKQREQEEKKKRAEGPQTHNKVWDEQKTGGVSYDDEQVPGQIRMFMPEGGGTPVQIYDQDKMIRFLAGKIDLLSGWMQGIVEKLDKVIDYQAQQLRRMDK